MSSLFKHLPLEQLQPGHYQPRHDFNPEALQDLAQSIQAQGLIEPLVVREIAPNHYEIVAGERRWRAAGMVGLDVVPCLISEYTDEQAAAVTLIENIQRQDLNLIEEAQGYQRLHAEFHFNQDEIATLMGKSRSHIANMMRLLALSPPVQELLRQRTLSLGHARALIGLSPAQQQTLAMEVRTKEWSVRRLEEEVRQYKLGFTPPPNQDRDILRLQNQLAEQVGSPVQILTEESGGWLKIKFFDNETLVGLLERMGLRYD